MTSDPNNTSESKKMVSYVFDDNLKGIVFLMKPFITFYENLILST